jgi:peptide/nickel transport system substrate-binding protein
MIFAGRTVERGRLERANRSGLLGCAVNMIFTRSRLFLAVLAWVPGSLAQEVWPKAWFEPALTASQAGINTFQQSAYLMDRDLPHLTDRLPDDPLVSVPLHQTGHHGGTARITSFDLTTFNNIEPLFTISADHKSVHPNLAEQWAYSADGRTLWVTLRKGIKWSDGHPLTSADFLFMLNDLQLNPDYQPVTPVLLKGVSLTALDDLRMRFDFERPNPLFVNIVAQFPEMFVAPRHYFTAFHPSYTDPATVDELMEQMGFINWTSFVLANMQGRIDESADRPMLRAFTMVSRSPSLIRYERNPYYFKVDPNGLQLPYIDSIEAQIIADTEVAVAKASTGELDFAGYSMPTEHIPLLKLGEKSSGIQVNIWRRLHGSDLVIQPNYNHADERLRALYWDFRFRRAMSIAINRDEMNQIIYFGRGVPRQVTVIPDSDYFDPAFAKAYTDYDPQTARALLR